MSDKHKKIDYIKNILKNIINKMEEIEEFIELNIAKTNKNNILKINFGKMISKHLFNSFVFDEELIKVVMENLKERISSEKIKLSGYFLKKFIVWNQVHLLKTFSNLSSEEKTYKLNIIEKKISEKNYIYVEEQLDTTTGLITFSSENKYGVCEYEILELQLLGEYNGMVILIKNNGEMNGIEIEINKPIEPALCVDIMNIINGSIF